MCCFVGPKPSFWKSLFGGGAVKVSHTRIFARIEGEEQILVYSMSLSAASEVAMVLPLPVKPGVGEGALRFVSLEKYPSFFEDMASGFFVPPPQSIGGPSRGGFSMPRLKVHQVGSFEASFVPSRKDFARLDPRFRFSDEVWQKLPNYEDYGFAVFQLRPGQKVHIHPMALRFQTRDLTQIFFPTVHVHDGKVRSLARFDHTLYYQLSSGRARRASEFPSYRPARGFMKAEKTEGLVALDDLVLQQSLSGNLPNEDTRIAA